MSRSRNLMLVGRLTVTCSYTQKPTVAFSDQLVLQYYQLTSRHTKALTICLLQQTWVSVQASTPFLSSSNMQESDPCLSSSHLQAHALHLEVSSVHRSQFRQRKTPMHRSMPTATPCLIRDGNWQLWMTLVSNMKQRISRKSTHREVSSNSRKASTKFLSPMRDLSFHSDYCSRLLSASIFKKDNLISKK